MATTRLRKTFQYPTDDEDAEMEEGMDEQDQEELISKLSTRDTSSTNLYTQLLLILPLSPVLLYIPQIFDVSLSVPSILAIASLLASAYTLYFLPLPPVTGSTTSDSSAISPSKKGKSTGRGSYGYRVPAQPTTSEEPLPYLTEDTSALVRKYLVGVNGAICAILALYELTQGRSWSEGMMVGGGYVPVFVLAVIMWARRELRVVDLGELERLRYRSKGA
ncbi:hypothetical protein BDV96DRAFT_611310 [Lophiotrema nucula]|uniref:Uncharacterized protein n=1 Tax=Lophiotrema nucula TaxID=690887 RepID=A0A6A5ZF35_9PLEO|nr:hypothetical protein BDV96DRAFT_611310 [Lophiotrema nucula]